MKLTLRYLNGALRGREVEFTRLPVVLGSDPRDDVFYDGFFHRMVSKAHAQLRAQDGALMVADRSDGKPTFVNGRPLPEGGALVLKAGDQLSLGEGGPGVLIVKLDGAEAEPDTAAPPPAAPAREAVPPAAPAAPRPPEKFRLEFTEGARRGQTRDFTAAVLTLGRRPECEFVFERPDEDAPVSGRHAELSWDGGRWQLTDLNSTNGTYLNGVRVNKAALKSGDTLQLTPKGAKLRVTVGEPAEPPPPPSPPPADGAASGRTVMLEAVGAGELAPPVLHLEIISGPRKGERLSFTQPEVTLGRAPENPVCVADTQGGVSARHARVKFEGGNWILSDLGSTNGTYLDGRKLAAPQILKGNELIRLSAWGPELRVTLGAATGTSQKVGRATMQMAIQDAVSAVKRDEDRKRGAALAAMETKQATAQRGLWALLLLLVVGAGAGGWWLWKRLERERADAALREQALSAQMTEMKKQNQELNGHLADYEKRDAEKGAQIEELLRKAGEGGAQAGNAYNQLLGAVSELKAQNGALREQLSGQIKSARQRRDSIGEGGDSDTAEKRAQLDAMIAQYNRRLGELEHKSGQLDQRLAQAGTTGAAAAAGAGGLGKAQIYSRNARAIVLIRHTFEAGGKTEAVEGTGWCARASGLIVTNRHVAMPWTEEGHPGRSVQIEIYFSGSREGYGGEVVRDHPNPEVDLALLRVKGSGSGFPVVAGIEQTDDSLSVGDEAYIIGFPLGSGTYHEGVATPTFTAGSISKKTKFRIQYDAVTYPGSSGSPVFNNQGRVAAIHFQGQLDQSGQKTQGINYGVPVDFVQELLK